MTEKLLCKNRKLKLLRVPRQVKFMTVGKLLVTNEARVIL